MPPLILMVYSRLDTGIQSATEKFLLKRVLHIVLTAPDPRLSDVCPADALVLPFSVLSSQSKNNVLPLYMSS